MNTLGKTGISVSKLCFGSLTMSSFQADLSIEEGANLIVQAFNQGVNFIDTAEIYDNYDYIKKALEVIPREELVIATKAYSYNYDTAMSSLEQALDGLGTDYIDIFLLHEQESEHTLRGHREALETFYAQKQEGTIRATGISSHFVRCIEAAKDIEEIEVIHPILNIEGIGIQDGTVEEMIQSIKSIREKGVGVYSMKSLGGGHLIARNKEALEWINSLDFIDSVAVGMQSIEEVNFNCDFFMNNNEDNYLLNKLKTRERRLIVEDYCRGCGACVERCKNDGIKLVDGQATPTENCILCGYCATVCPDFCIKVI